MAEQFDYATQSEFWRQQTLPLLLEMKQHIDTMISDWDTPHKSLCTSKDFTSISRVYDELEHYLS